MSELLQWILVALIVVLAFALSVYLRIRDRKRGTDCAGCAIKEHCRKNGVDMKRKSGHDRCHTPADKNSDKKGCC